MKQRYPIALAALLGAVTLAGVLAWSVAPVFAQQGSATANMQVSANVIRKCWVAALPLNFGAYDPVQVNSTTELLAQTKVAVACTKGTAVTIGLDNGTNAQGQTRRMAGPTGNFLPYEINKDAANSQRWGDAAGERLDAGVAPSRQPREFIVYGRIAGGYDVVEGNYQDTVLVTVQF